jgi:hypothetical protein
MKKLLPLIVVFILFVTLLTDVRVNAADSISVETWQTYYPWETDNVTLIGHVTKYSVSITDEGFYYGRSVDNAIKQSVGSRSIHFTGTFSNLLANTTYYYRAYAVDSVYGEADGEWHTFKLPQHGFGTSPQGLQLPLGRIADSQDYSQIAYDADNMTGLFIAWLSGDGFYPHWIKTDGNSYIDYGIQPNGHLTLEGNEVWCASFGSTGTIGHYSLSEDSVVPVSSYSFSENGNYIQLIGFIKLINGNHLAAYSLAHSDNTPVQINFVDLKADGSTANFTLFTTADNYSGSGVAGTLVQNPSTGTVWCFFCYDGSGLEAIKLTDCGNSVSVSSSYEPFLNPDTTADYPEYCPWMEICNPEARYLNGEINLWYNAGNGYSDDFSDFVGAFQKRAYQARILIHENATITPVQTYPGLIERLTRPAIAIDSSTDTACTAFRCIDSKTQLNNQVCMMSDDGKITLLGHSTAPYTGSPFSLHNCPVLAGGSLVAWKDDNGHIYVYNIRTAPP